MAVKEKIRIRLKGYDHQLVDQQLRESLQQQSVQAQEFQVLYRFQQRSRLLQFFVLFISIRTAVSSLR